MRKIVLDLDAFGKIYYNSDHLVGLLVSKFW